MRFLPIAHLQQHAGISGVIVALRSFGIVLAKQLRDANMHALHLNAALIEYKLTKRFCSVCENISRLSFCRYQFFFNTKWWHNVFVHI